ncbi:MAG: dUTP diphosphatase [Planctomycetota bacterium]
MSRPLLRVPLEILPHGRGLDAPAYATSGAAGLDLRAAVTEAVVLEPGARALVPTGLRMAVPVGYEAQVRARSGWVLSRGVIIPNAPGTIDSDYRGEVKVILANLGEEAVRIERGMRIAQLVFAPVIRAGWEVREALDETSRGRGGFGHTGPG